MAVGDLGARLAKSLLIREWSRDLQELAQAWVLARGKSVGHFVAFLFDATSAHDLLLLSTSDPLCTEQMKQAGCFELNYRSPF